MAYVSYLWDIERFEPADLQLDVCMVCGVSGLEMYVDMACDLQLDVCMVCGVSGLEMWTWRVTCSWMCAWYVVCRGWKCGHGV